MIDAAGLKAKYHDRVVDSPLNEPLILGAATGLGYEIEHHLDELSGLCTPMSGSGTSRKCQQWRVI